MINFTQYSVKLELERYDQAREKRSDAVVRYNEQYRLVPVPAESRSRSPGTAASDSRTLLSDQQLNEFQTRLRELVATRRAQINERTAEFSSKLDETTKQKDKARGTTSSFTLHFQVTRTSIRMNIWMYWLLIDD